LTYLPWLWLKLIQIYILTEILARYHQLITAIDAERKEEEAFFKKMHLNKGIKEKLESGFIWYPVQIIRKNYTIGEYVEVTIEKAKENEIPHKFSEGAAASIFNIQNERRDFKVVVSSVRKNRMQVLLHVDSLDKLDVLDKGLTGVELVYDDKPYQIMEQAIRDVMISRSENIRLLRNALAKGELVEKGNLIEYLEVAQPNDGLLNKSQQEAIDLCIQAPLMGIIHGPPGTGKTTTLVSLVQRLVKLEKRVLVCASSNNAVDLLAERLSDKGLKVLRIGNITRIHDKLLHLTLDEKMRNHPEWNRIKKVKTEAQELDKKASQFKRNFGHEEKADRREMRKEVREMRRWAYELEDRLMDEIIRESEVIACTLAGASHRLLKGLHFRTVIIDEASQSLEPECWNAILKADRAIMAGDHKQLPPTVKSTEAGKLGFETTMLDIMTDNIPHSAMLEIQYRMNDSILGFSNERFYSGKLRSDATVKNRMLRNESHALVFIDTAGCGFDEAIHKDHRSYANHGEYFIMREHMIVQRERLLGVSIGVISPYAEQVRYIKQEISEDADMRALDIEVNSIDGFQGQEKEVIYISLVRSNDRGEIGFLKDERRLNVAMTRAQKKLVIIGDSATIGQHALYTDLMNFIEKNGFYDSAWNYMMI
jgi:ATP-dependent RNA/DNA helicase IGHMBP2